MLTTLSVADIAETLSCGRPGCSCRRQNGRNISAHCPAHDDANPSLSLSEGDNGKILVHCNGGCAQADVINALKARSLWPETKERPHVRNGQSNRQTSRRIANTYDYVDEQDSLLFQAVRYDPKGFNQRVPNGTPGTWNYTLEGTRRVLYHLPEVLAAVASGKAVYVCEGEKDADALRAWGVCSTCNPMGAEKWEEGYTDTLTGATVVILPDNDEAGRKHGQKVATALHGKAQTVRVVELPNLPQKGDVYDWIEAGGTKEALRDMAKAAPEWIPAPAPIPAQEPMPAIEAQSTDFPRLTDLGNAERFVTRHGREVRYCYQTGRWLVWDGKRWQTDDMGEISRRAKNTVRNIYGEAEACPDDGLRKMIADHARRSENASRLTALVQRAESEIGIPIRASDLDQNQWLLNCANGTLDLKTGELLPHNPQDMITKIVPVAYDPNAKADTWERFLAQILPDADVRTFLQRAIGYALTGDISEQCIFALYGQGDNGKSTLIGALTDTLLKDYSKTAPSKLLLAQNSDGGANPEVADLCGARLVTCVEVDHSKRMAEGLVKQLTGGDRITARRLYQDFVQFNPTHKIFFAFNHKPIIRGNDHAIWRRIKLIPFTATVTEAQKDKHLPDKLRAELPGILAWAVRGCLDWQAQGLGEPEAVLAATSDYRAEMDVLQAFLDERCILGTSHRVTTGDLYQSYKGWCADNSEHELGKRTFGQRLLERRGILAATNIGVHHARGWQGIGLLHEGNVDKETNVDADSKSIRLVSSPRMDLSEIMSTKSNCLLPANDPFEGVA